MRLLKPARRKPRQQQRDLRQMRRQTRRRARPQWVRPALGALAFAVGTGLVGGAAYWAVDSGAVARTAAAAHAQVLTATAGAGFAVDDVFVEGRHESEAGQVLAALAVVRGTPMLGFDPLAAKERVEKLGWVARAEVMRLLPGTIYVRLEERRPIAIWQHQGTFELVDAGGVVIGSDGLDRYRHLKVVVGDGAPAGAPALLAMLESQPKLKESVTAAVLVGGRRWNLHLKGGLEVKLPADEPALAWERLAKLERDHGLLARDVAAVDLRLPDRTVVRLLHGAQGRREKSGSST